MAGFNIDDYVTVPERVVSFYEKFPEGSLQSEIIEMIHDHLVVVRSYAYRTPEDPRPGIGHSSLAIPGSTPYTKGSELENAETSAVGRAIAMLGFHVKKSIASSDEIRNKGGPRSRPTCSSGDDGSLIGTVRGRRHGDLRLQPPQHPRRPGARVPPPGREGRHPRPHARTTGAGPRHAARAEVIGLG